MPKGINPAYCCVPIESLVLYPPLFTTAEEHSLNSLLLVHTLPMNLERSRFFEKPYLGNRIHQIVMRARACSPKRFERLFNNGHVYLVGSLLWSLMRKYEGHPAGLPLIHLLGFIYPIGCCLTIPLCLSTLCKSWQIDIIEYGTIRDFRSTLGEQCNSSSLIT